MSSGDQEPVVIDTFWDEEAKVWAATAQGGLGVVTEADTLGALRTRLAKLLPDFLETAGPVPFVPVQGQVP